MKKIFLFSTKLAFFLVEIPLLAFLTLVIYIDVRLTNVMLIPLAAVITAAIIFSLIFFFRAVIISFDRVRCVGPFSSRYSAFIKKDRTLVITRMPHRRLKIEIFGYNNDGDDNYSWLKNDTPTIINLFRTKTNGSNKAIQKILRYFDVEEDGIAELFSQDGITRELDKTVVSTEIDGNNKLYRIFFKETL